PRARGAGHRKGREPLDTVGSRAELVGFSTLAARALVRIGCRIRDAVLRYSSPRATMRSSLARALLVLSIGPAGMLPAATLSLAAARAAAAPRAAVRAAPSPGQRPREGDFVLRGFPFRSGETLPELRIHYLTLGAAARDRSGAITNAVLIL